MASCCGHMAQMTRILLSLPLVNVQRCESCASLTSTVFDYVNHHLALWKGKLVDVVFLYVSSIISWLMVLLCGCGPVLERVSSWIDLAGSLMGETRVRRTYDYHIGRSLAAA